MKNIKHSLKTLQHKLDDPFWRNSLIFFVGSMVAGLLNYLYYPILGRLLSLHDFGEIQVLFSILLDIVVFFGALSIAITNITANAGKSFKNSNIIELEQATLVALYVLFLGWLAVAPALSHFLKLGSSLPLIALYAAVMLSLITNTRQAFLQGRQDFWGVTIGTLIGAASKLLFSAVLVYAGYGVIGAIAGLALAQLLHAVYTTYRARQKGLSFPLSSIHFKGFKVVLPELYHVVPALAVSLVVSVLYSSDIIVIKHFFSPVVAGEYAGVAAIARIIIFLIGPIGLVMFSSIKLTNSPAENAHILRRSMVLLGLIGGSACLFFTLLPQLTVSLLLGTKYTPAAHYLPWLSVALLLVSAANLLLFYNLALRLKRVIANSLSGLAAVVALTALHHGSILQIISNISCATLVIISIDVVMRLADHRRR